MASGWISGQIYWGRSSGLQGRFLGDVWAEVCVDLLGEVLMVSGQISWGVFLESTPKLEDGRNFIRYSSRVHHRV